MTLSKIEDHNFDLKPCPFCGNENPNFYYSHELAWYEIRCSSDRLNCILPQAIASTSYEAVDKWNTRGNPYHRPERRPIKSSGWWLKLETKEDE